MNKVLAMFFAILLALLSISSVVAMPSPDSGAANLFSGFSHGKHAQTSGSGIFLSAKKVETDKSCVLKKIPAESLCNSNLDDLKKNKLSLDERRVLRRQIRDVEQDFDAAKK